MTNLQGTAALKRKVFIGSDARYDLAFDYLTLLFISINLAKGVEFLPDKQAQIELFEAFVQASAQGFSILPLLGSMMTMSGLSMRPAFYDVDFNLTSGRIIGLS